MSKDISCTPSEEATLSSRGYYLIRRLGEGSYAKVYLAQFKGTTRSQKDVSSRLACKIIDTSKAPKDFVRKFLPRELEILGKLNHPHIIHIHSIFQRKTKYFIFMRFGENGDLLEFILKKGAISEPQTRVWFRQMALAIQYLHNMQISHRDLKCENVLITSNYNVKLADFGFARYIVDAQGQPITSETYCGSLSYAAPEILRGQPYHPKPTDIWSLGVVLYIMLNKAMPFDDTNIKKLYEQQAKKEWRFRAKVVDILSAQVKTLETFLLEPEVAKRYKIDQIIVSDWVAMDPRLTQLTPAERAAVEQSNEEGRRRITTAVVDTKKKRLDEAEVNVLKDLDESDRAPNKYKGIESVPGFVKS